MRLYWRQYDTVVLTLVATIVIRRYRHIGDCMLQYYLHWSLRSSYGDAMVLATVCYSTTYTGRYDRHTAMRLYWRLYVTVLLTLVATIVIRRCGCIGDCMLQYYLHWSLRSSYGDAVVLATVCYSTTYTGRYDRHTAMRWSWRLYVTVLLTLVATIVIRRCDGIGDCMLQYYLHWSLRSSYGDAVVLATVCYSTTYNGRYDRHKAMRLYWRLYVIVLLTLVATIVIRRRVCIGDSMLYIVLFTIIVTLTTLHVTDLWSVCSMWCASTRGRDSLMIYPPNQPL